MSNRLEELHYKYKRYYLKQILKFSGVLVLIISVMGISYFLMQVMQDETLPVKPEIKIVKELKQDPILTPSTDNRKAYALNVTSNELEASLQKLKVKQKPKKVVTKLNVRKKVHIPVLMHAPVKEVSTKFFSNIHEVKPLEVWIEKYNKKRSYSAAIYIAKQYYFDEDYEQSGIWAKRANQLNRNKEEAWLYYSKSVYALGNTTKARRILNIYLQYKNSTKAELLLSEWRQK
ncbi:MAG TPA: hypothetical protein EYO73_01565 [Sulfurimonas sp.]|nr:hypothetical protein [Sulfurimonas sp.]